MFLINFVSTMHVYTKLFSQVRRCKGLPLALQDNMLLSFAVAPVLTLCFSSALFKAPVPVSQHRLNKHHNFTIYIRAGI